MQTALAPRQSTKNNIKKNKKQCQKKQNTIPIKQKNNTNKNKKHQKTNFWHSCIWGLELRLFPGVQEDCFFVVWYCFFWELFFFGIGVFGIYFLGTILWLFKYLCSPPLLHKLDNVVHENEYLAPDVFGNASRALYGGSQVDPQTEEIEQCVKTQGLQSRLKPRNVLGLFQKSH